jgi:hypothetical protein
MGAIVKRCGTSDFRLKRCAASDYRLKGGCPVECGCYDTLGGSIALVVSGVSLCTGCRGVSPSCGLIFSGGDINGTWVLPRYYACYYRLDPAFLYDAWGCGSDPWCSPPPYKESGSLSTGQKCTTILPILLLDSDDPLLIDQPEDNLDNRFIFECVVGSIQSMKARRQLVFVTHNPNIPVLGDAERLFVLESDGVNARLANQGTVDECKGDILTLLEGGEEAFRRRQNRYANRDVV